MEKIARIKGIDPKKAHFSFICYDLSHLTDYTKSVDTPLFRLLKKRFRAIYFHTAGPAGGGAEMLKTKRDTVGIRVPDNLICRTLVKELGSPIAEHIAANRRVRGRTY